MLRVFEIDDWPRGADRALEHLDRFRSDFPKFRCTVFAIPEEMTERDWDELESRSWIRTGIHGFRHLPGECSRGSASKMASQLDAVTQENRWHPYFKAPWHDYNRNMFELLRERDIVACTIGLQGVGYPVPKGLRVWNPVQAQMRGIQCIGAHTDVGQGRAGMRTTIPRLIDRGKLRSWLASDRWCWLDYFTRDALTKLNLGCGSQIWEGWDCLDMRPRSDTPVIKWDWNQILPYGACTVDVILVSHALMYCDQRNYRKVLLDCWRVLQPRGVLRISEDETTRRIWRPAGTVHRSGMIRSEPTAESVAQAMRDVGFEVYRTGPGETHSPHQDILRGDTRGRLWRQGFKFYLEGVKAIDISNLHKTHRQDPRGRKHGRWKLPEHRPG